MTDWDIVKDIVVLAGLWEHNTEQDEILQNHEMRLHDLDGK